LRRRGRETCSLAISRPYSIPVRVYYQDTDAGGVVFHAQYLAFMERARTERLNDAGIDLARFTEKHGLLFLVHHISVTFHRPALLNDLLTVSAEVAKMGRASFVFRQCVERAGTLLVEADITLALVDRRRMKPARMPEDLEQALKR
jgi:acyl-CoA thioester hydrolase